MFQLILTTHMGRWVLSKPVFKNITYIFLCEESNYTTVSQALYSLNIIFQIIYLGCLYM